ncbi:hypothetical protein FGO68_gene5467 [Halteria grandinella]|uniref:Tc1-like transposase DDE domain-containing protein n=1 Tax=Halteria grandinella TaxID=5974 RepID=A0A8J8NAL5_HALGN|nr:hypothetical protein FGO68_gene5467 [Halteria grandinella]
MKQYRLQADKVPSLIPKRRLRLKKLHKDYLLSEKTLQEWAHLSIKQRAKLFHRTFPEVKLSHTSLWRFYKSNGIRFKYIQKVKKVIDFHNQEYHAMFMHMVELLEQAREQKLPIVLLDEAVFTFNTFKTKAWSLPYKCIQVNDFAIKVKTQAFIGGITLDDGLLEWVIHPKSIKTVEFQAFLHQLSERFKGKPFALFLDNLSVHKTNLSKDLFKELGISPIFNIPYSPQFNGIESYFSLLKGEYKNLLLQRIMKGQSVDAVQLIKQATEMVDPVKVKKCVQYGFDCIDKQLQELKQ